LNNIALIPARLGSKRLPRKNIKLLNGIPLIAYTIKAALDANIFSEIIVSTDDKEIANIAESWGASVPILRPSELATELSTDFEWIEHCLENMVSSTLDSNAYLTILRPTNPVRTPNTIRIGNDLIRRHDWADSLRAMQITDKHPGKMWYLDRFSRATAVMDQSGETIFTYNRPIQSLEKIWVQNASLEIIKYDTIKKYKNISGNEILGFEMPGLEGFDINSEMDWKFLEFLISLDKNLLPDLS
jgi:CMP-N,N'-diacetyllegionaminic acid synthase